MSSPRKRPARPAFESAWDKKLDLEKWLDNPTEICRKEELYTILLRIEEWRRKDHWRYRLGRLFVAGITFGRVGRPIRRSPRYVLGLHLTRAVQREVKDYESRYGSIIQEEEAPE